jgi:flagellar hook-associated protein 1 FlgK
MVGLDSASYLAQSALQAVTAQTAVVSRNISGASSTNYYSEKSVSIGTSTSGSAAVLSITNAQNDALFNGFLNATSASATQTALSAGLTQLSQTIGDTTDNVSPSALLSGFTNALQAYEASPSDSTFAANAVSAASSLASGLNSATTTVQSVREQADADMAASVNIINSLLSKFQALNTQVKAATVAGADATDLLDSRDEVLQQLSSQIGVTTTKGANNDMSIYTDSGVTLFQGTARTVSFTPTATYTASTTGNVVVIDGVPVTGSGAPMPVSLGKLAGLATLRDTVTVTYQNQLDQIAGGLINTFAESDQTGGAAATQPGLFTFSGAPTLPASSTTPGLAGDIKIAARVDPTQGGNASLLRDGGISNSSGSTTYTYNTTGAASYTTRLQSLITSLSQSQNFNSSGRIDPTDTLAGYASASVGWLSAQRQSVSSASDYQSALVSSATSALSNATGANLDSEMSKMLDLENAYSASAKLMSTINSMFTNLLTNL